MNDACSVVHVRGLVNARGKVFDLDLEAGLDVTEDLVVLLVRDERDGETLGAESTSSADTMKILVRLARHIEVDNDVNLFDIDTSTEQVCADHDSIFALLEASIDLESLLLRHGLEAGDTGELLTLDDLVKLLGVILRLGENNNLVEFEIVEQLDELLDLLVLVKLHVVLLEAVEVELGVVIDVHFEGVLHEHLADLLGLVRQRGREHHDLSLGLAGHEDLLHLSSHVSLVEHLVALIENEHLQVVEGESFVVRESEDTTRSTNDDMGRLGALENLLVFLDGDTTVENLSDDIRKVLGETSHLVLDLISKLTSVAHDESGGGLGVLLELMKHREDEDGGLTHTGHSLANNIATLHGVRDALLLNFRGMLETAVGDGTVQLLLKQEVLEASHVHTGITSGSI